MSLNAMHRSIVIFSNKTEKAESKLNALINELNEEIIARNENYVKTTTKTIQTLRFPFSRGYRYQEAYVDNEINYPEAINLILTKLVPPHFYIDSEYDENYSWKDHIHYF